MPHTVDVGANSITVAGRVQRGGTITVYLSSGPVELEVEAGESPEHVARRLTELLNGRGVPAALRNETVVDVDLAIGRMPWSSAELTACQMMVSLTVDDDGVQCGETPTVGGNDAGVGREGERCRAARSQVG